MQELSLINIRIRGQEQHMRKVKGKLSGHAWEVEVRALKKLTGKKDEINRKIRHLGD